MLAATTIGEVGQSKVDFEPGKSRLKGHTTKFLSICGQMANSSTMTMLSIAPSTFFAPSCATIPKSHSSSKPFPSEAIVSLAKCLACRAMPRHWRSWVRNLLDWMQARLPGLR